MADAKIEIRVGAVSFSGEGDGKWLSDQLDKLLEKIPELASAAPAAQSEQSHGAIPPAAAGQSRAKGTLANFLASKNAKANKTRKFLATALWLQDSERRERLTTSDVKKATSQHSQGSLGNASQSLTNNVKQGFIAKDGKQFYVTDEGRADLG